MKGLGLSFIAAGSALILSSFFVAGTGGTALAGEYGTTTTMPKSTTTTKVTYPTTTTHATYPTTTVKPTTTTAHETTTTAHQTTTTTEKATTTTTEKATTTTTGATTTTSSTMATTTTTTANMTLLTLRARVINTNGGTATVQDFSLEANGPVDIDGVTDSPAVTLASVPPGSYQLRDRILVAAALGYTSSGWSCAGSADQTPSSVVLDAGEDAVCAVVFSDTAATGETTTTVAGATTTVAGTATTVAGGGGTTATTAVVLQPTAEQTGTGEVETVTPAAVTSTGSLPNTGYDPSKMLDAAGAALIVGGIAVGVSRRRKRNAE
jgi:LPXTG-motif cell wall-anchored protein